MGLLACLLFEWCNQCYPYRWINRGLGRQYTLPNKFTQLDSGRTGNHSWGAFMWLGVVSPRVELDTRVICRRFGKWNWSVRHHVQRVGVGSYMALLICWLILAVWDSGRVCSISSSQWLSSSFRFFESWALCLSFVAQSVCFFCSLCCQVWRLCEANMASRSYLSPCFMSSLLLSALTYSIFRATTGSRSLPENSSPAPTIMSGLIPIIDSLFRITYRGLLPASNLSCYIPSDSNFLVHSLGRVGVRGQAGVSGVQTFCFWEARDFLNQMFREQRQGMYWMQSRKIKKSFQCFCLVKRRASYFMASFVFKIS